jgi:hypothetical protein
VCVFRRCWRCCNIHALALRQLQTVAPRMLLLLLWLVAAVFIEAPEPLLLA